MLTRTRLILPFPFRGLVAVVTVGEASRSPAGGVPARTSAPRAVAARFLMVVVDVASTDCCVRLNWGEERDKDDHWDFNNPGSGTSRILTNPFLIRHTQLAAPPSTFAFRPPQLLHPLYFCYYRYAVVVAL